MTRTARCLIAAVVGIGLWSGGAASAAVIRLKNGNVFEGDVKSRTEQEVVVEIPDLGTLAFAPSEIAAIVEDAAADEGPYRHRITLANGNRLYGTVIRRDADEVEVSMAGAGTITLAAAEIASVEEVASQDTGQLNEQAARLAREEEEARRRTRKAQPPVSPRRSEIAEPQARARTPGQRTRGMGGMRRWLLTDPLANKTLKAVIKVLGALGAWVFVILLVLGVYFAVCVQRLAERTGTGDEWMAWVPLLNFYLACRVGGRPGWWLLLYPIPLLGTVIDLLVWAGIAAAREKSPWLCLFMLLPVANWILVGYLAFTKDPEERKDLPTLRPSTT